MRQFEHPNMEGFLCPLCGTNDDEPVFLLGIPGTEQDGLVECQQVHVKCYAEFVMTEYPQNNY